MHQILNPKTTLSGYRQRIDHTAAVPRTLTRAQFNKLSPTEQEAYDFERRIWFGNDMTIATAKSTELVESARSVLRTRSPFAIGDRGLILDGPATVGKTTTLFRFARMVENKAAKDNPKYREDGEVPVVYVEVPPRATPKSVASQILDFFGYGYSKRSATQDQILRWAQDQLVTHRTRLLIFDELQMLRLDGKTGDDAINVLKTLMNNVDCLMLLAGIDLRRGLASRAAEQIMGRCEIIEIAPFGLDEVGRGHWHALVRNFGEEMRLLDGEPDDLLAFADPLHTATQGRIGALRRILTRALDHAIENREAGNGEFITADLLFPDAVVASSPSLPPARQQRSRSKAA